MLRSTDIQSDEAEFSEQNERIATLSRERYRLLARRFEGSQRHREEAARMGILRQRLHLALPPVTLEQMDALDEVINEVDVARSASIEALRSIGLADD